MERTGSLAVTTTPVHGHVRAFVDAGDGPVLLLLHGIGSDLNTWDRVLPLLVARGFRVVAPDFLGHGRSAKPRADYSLGGFANGMRDLLTLLDIDRVTVVGHSFGGGVAMQFAYQFPERAERVMLVGSGGLGRDVHPMLRMLAVPGTAPALALAASRPIRPVAAHALRLIRRTGAAQAADFAEIATIYDGLADAAARAAFLHVLRAAVDWRGQVVTMLDRAYLAAAMPVSVVWGARDTVIPLAHAQQAQQAFPSARVEVFDRAGHFPHRDDPERFVEVLTAFVSETSASDVPRGQWRELLLSRQAASG